MIDALLSIVGRIGPSALPVSLAPGRRLIVVTAHRRESFGEPLLEMFRAVRELAARHGDVEVVYPVHPNPNVRGPVGRILGPLEGDNVHLTEPLSYLPFVALMDRATLLLTDSGGIQEEAPSLGKPVLVMRDTTERPEAVAGGTVKLVGTDYDTIVRETSRLLADPAAYDAMAKAHNPYGDGRATERIVKACEKFFM